MRDPQCPDGAAQRRIGRRAFTPRSWLRAVCLVALACCTGSARAAAGYVRVYIPQCEPQVLNPTAVLQAIRVEVPPAKLELVSGLDSSGQPAPAQLVSRLLVIAPERCQTPVSAVTLALFSRAETEPALRHLQLSDVDQGNEPRVIAIAVAELLNQHSIFPLPAASALGVLPEEPRLPGAEERTQSQPLHPRSPERDTTSASAVRLGGEHFVVRRSAAGNLAGAGLPSDSVIGSTPARLSSRFAGMTLLARAFPSGKLALVGPALTGCARANGLLSLCARSEFTFGSAGLYSDDANGAVDNIRTRSAVASIGPSLMSGGPIELGIGLRVSAGIAELDSSQRRKRGFLSLIGAESTLRGRIAPHVSALIGIEIGSTLSGIHLENTSPDHGAAVSFGGAFLAVQLGLAVD
ncbi:MAG TPA: hypothetical protein VFQ61_22035 [Polyangiaceae bacterium]|nr:hypothetical protein [Polyangiaceae bacterium]